MRTIDKRKWQVTSEVARSKLLRAPSSWLCDFLPEATKTSALSSHWKNLDLIIALPCTFLLISDRHAIFTAFFDFLAFVSTKTCWSHLATSRNFYFPGPPPHSVDTRAFAPRRLKRTLVDGLPPLGGKYSSWRAPEGQNGS